MDTHGFEQSINKVNLDFHDALHCAKQRALRIICIRRGHEFLDAWLKGEAKLELTDEERELLPIIETVWIDGLVNGLKTHGDTHT
jgi:hypothetical protein